MSCSTDGCFVALTDASHRLTTGSGASPAAPLLVSVLVAILAALLSLHVMTPNVDVSWLLVAGERLIGGAELHRDIIEVNPPFSVWLYMPFLYGERATGIHAETLLAFLLPLFALASLLVSGSILRRAGWLAEPASLWLLPVATLLLSWLFPGDFGQREQIATIALLPWLALLAARDRSPDFDAGSKWQILLAGLGAAVFVMIKPPMAALALAAPALWVAAMRRSLRPLFAPETLIGAAVTSGYVVYVLVFDRAFLTEVAPSLTAYYLPLRLSFMELLAISPLVAPAFFAAVTWLFSRPQNINRASAILLIAGAGYLPGFLLMGKGWTYQAMPFLFFGPFAFFMQVERSRFSFSGSPVRSACLLMVVALMGFFFFGSYYSPQPPPPRLAGEIVDLTGPHPTVMSIAVRLQPAHPLTRMIGARYLSRDPALWRAHNAELLADRQTDETARVAYLAQRDRDIADAAARIENLRPDVVIAGGVNLAPAEAAIAASPEIAAALLPYAIFYRDAGTTVFVRKRLPTGR